MVIYALLFFALAVYHYFILPKENKEEPKQEKTAGNVRKELLEVITSFFTKKSILWSVLFIILYRFAEGFAIKIALCFLKLQELQAD
jgi:PAT family beta-lactamase induction signal transducer AmpG